MVDRLLLGALLAAILSSAAGAQLPASSYFAEPDFRLATLESRLSALLPTMEAILGAPFREPPRVRVISPEQLEEILWEEEVVYHSTMDELPRRERLLHEARTTAAANAWDLVGKVDLKTNTIHILPTTIQGTTYYSENPDDLGVQGVVDLVVIHEAVHVWQGQHEGLVRAYGIPRTMEEQDCRNAVLEGHAEYITQKTAEALGLPELWNRYEQAFAQSDSSQTENGEITESLYDFSYLHGHRTFRRYAERLGAHDAFRQLVRAPLFSRRQILHPTDALAPESATADLVTLGERLEDVIGPGRGRDVSPVPPWSVRSNLTGMERSAIRGIEEQYLGGRSVISWPALGAGAELLSVSCLVFEDEDSAKAALDGIVTRPKAGPLTLATLEVFPQDDGKFRALETSTSISVMQRSGSLDLLNEPLPTQVLLATEGPFLFELIGAGRAWSSDKLANKLKQACAVVRTPEIAEAGGIYGTVTSLQQPAIGAMVTAFNEAGQPVRTSQTDPFGRFALRSLLPGRYAVGFGDAMPSQRVAVDVAPRAWTVLDGSAPSAPSKRRDVEISVTFDDGSTPRFLSLTLWPLANGENPIVCERKGTRLVASIPAALPTIFGAIKADGVLHDELVGTQLPNDAKIAIPLKKPRVAFLKVTDATTGEVVPQARAYPYVIDPGEQLTLEELASRGPFLEEHTEAMPLHANEMGLIPIGEQSRRTGWIVFADGHETTPILVKRRPTGDHTVALERGAALELRIQNWATFSHPSVTATPPDGIEIQLPWPYADGTIVVPGLALGNWTITVRQGVDGRVFGTADVTLSELQALTPLVIETSPQEETTRVTGTVEFEEPWLLPVSGEIFAIGIDPMTSGVIAVSPLSPDFPEGLTSDLSFEFRGIPPGRYRCELPHLRIEQEVTFELTERPCVLSVPRQAELRFEGLDMDRATSPGIQVYLHPEFPPETVEATGTMRFATPETPRIFCPPGKTWVIAHCPGHTTQRFVVDLVAGSATTISLVLGEGGSLEIKPRTSEGKWVLGGLTVQLTGANGAYFTQSVKSRFGSASLERIPAGRYSLVVTQDATSVESKPIEITITNDTQSTADVVF